MAADANQLADKQASMKERMNAARIAQRVKTRKENREKEEMQASVTTLTINGPEEPMPEPMPVETVAEGINSVEPESVTVPVTFLADLQRQIDELKAVKQLTGSGGMSFEQLAYFIQEMKKPDTETAEKLAKEKARRAQEQKNMIELAMLEEEQKLQREANCNHRKENGRSAVVGQIHSDGYYHGVCQHCFKTFTPVKPTTEQMMMGVS